MADCSFHKRLTSYLLVVEQSIDQKENSTTKCVLDGKAEGVKDQPVDE